MSTVATIQIPFHLNTQMNLTLLCERIPDNCPLNGSHSWNVSVLSTIKYKAHCLAKQFELLVGQEAMCLSAENDKQSLTVQHKIKIWNEFTYLWVAELNAAFSVHAKTNYMPYVKRLNALPMLSALFSAQPFYWMVLM